MCFQFLGSDEVNIVYPEDLQLSSEKSTEEVLGADMYPYVIMQLGSAYAGLIVKKRINSFFNQHINQHKS